MCARKKVHYVSPFPGRAHLVDESAMALVGEAAIEWVCFGFLAKEGL